MEYDCHPQIEKDLGRLDKICSHVKDLRPTLQPSTLKDHIQFRPVLMYAYNFYCDTIKSKCDRNNCRRWDHQHYISRGIELWKVYWAIDNRGKKHGLRIMMAHVKEQDINIFIGIFKKSDVENEQHFQKEIIGRLHQYFGKP